jgi:hypothetical protein
MDVLMNQQLLNKQQPSGEKEAEKEEQQVNRLSIQRPFSMHRNVLTPSEKVNN